MIIIYKSASSICLMVLIYLHLLLPVQSQVVFGELEKEAATHFLASDELKGRRTGSEGIFQAGDFIASAFSSFGCVPILPNGSWFQNIPFSAVNPGKDGYLKMDLRTYKNQDDLIFLLGEAGEFKGEAVFVKHGWFDEKTGHNDYSGKDLKGKVVFCLAGTPDSKAPNIVMDAMQKKQQWAAERGAIAVFEIYQLPFPWNFFKNYFSGESIRLVKPENERGLATIPYGWVRDIDDDNLDRIIEGTISMEGFYSGTKKENFFCRNVVAYVPGNDADLKNEFVVITAHYDHVGEGAQGGGAYSDADSIFNGARDNAIGTVALLGAAHSIATNPCKRSVIFVAFTGEELGLLGSSYFVDNPPIPLNQMIFNLNGDGAGYDVTTALSVIGYGRTGTDALLDSIALLAGLDLIKNPAPNQNLFDRSDNVSFAAKGVPAINISPGIEGFSAEILKHYHQVSDHSDTLDFDYLTKYWLAFTLASRALADQPDKPIWNKGDKYENAGKELYNLVD